MLVAFRPKRPTETPRTPQSVEDAPLRAELFTVSQLERHARTLASWHAVEGTRGRPNFAPAVSTELGALDPQPRAASRIRVETDRPNAQRTSARGSDELLARLASNEAALREAHALVTEAVKGGTRITPAAEWFVDNYHLIEEQIRTAKRHLPRDYNRELPRLVRTPALPAYEGDAHRSLSRPRRRDEGTPRVYHLALELISHSHGRIHLEGLRAFITAYQSVTPLRLGELWAIPIMLRLALIENLRRVVARVTAGRTERDLASVWATRLLEASARPEDVVLVLAELVQARLPLTDAFATELASRLQGHGPALVYPLSWLEQRLASDGKTVEQAFQLVSQSQATDQVSIGNTIGSLRLLGDTDWRVFVEASSGVERVLRAEPAGVYAEMDFATRDRYRHVVEDIAKRSPLSELEVAERAVSLAREAGGEAEGGAGSGGAVERASHVGYFLVDEGRRELERAAGMRPTLRQHAQGVPRRLRFGLYAAAIILLTMLATAAFVAAMPESASAPAAGRRLLSMAVFALAASSLAIAWVHWIITLVVRPHLLPRLDYTRGIPAEHRTLVAVPTLLTDLDEVAHLLEQLEVRFLANRDRELAFALVSDLRDAASETTPADEALVRAAREGIESLNQKYRVEGGSDPFYLFHRARKWNASEGAWMGWERKRGKMEELNRALRGRRDGFAVVVGDVAPLERTKYVITLDSDTQLPRDAAKQLVGTLAHPLNRASFDPRLGRVTRGYSVLQPRVAVTMASARRSRFAQLFGGDPGIDPYTRAVSDVYQDLFEEGSFVGKGIYDVDAFQLALDGRLPENRILSHDLLEGAYGRAGLVSDVTLFEDHPSVHAVDVSRRARWIRGDWQIMSWLDKRVPAGSVASVASPSVSAVDAPTASTAADAAARARGGIRSVANPISLLSQWKVLDNLRRSLIPGAMLLLLILGWTTPSGAVVATLAVLAIHALPGLLAAFTDLARRPREVSLARHATEVFRALGRQLERELFAIATLPYDAFVSFGAIGRTATRVLFTGRRLLEWRTASDAERSARADLPGAFREMWISPTIAALLLVDLSVVQPAALVAAGPVLLMWASAPAVSWWLSRPTPPERPELAPADVLFLRVLARRTWRFFETFVDAADNFLPPDNFQEDPPRGAAHRTSPTNIGLSLTANLAAYDFGYATVERVVARTEATFGSLDKMQRHHGHFFNWYDTTNLQPLRPMYISTVDSGNLAGHLLVLAAGLKALPSEPIVRAQTFSGLRDTLDVLLEAFGDQGSRSAAFTAARDVLDAPPATLPAARLALESLEAPAAKLRREAADSGLPEAIGWAKAFEGDRVSALSTLLGAAPWLDALGGEPTVQISRLGLDDETRDELVSLPTRAEIARLGGKLAPGLARARAELERRGDEDGRSTLAALEQALLLGAARAAETITALHRLADRAVEFADLDYEFLYDRSRHLLSIGYNIDDHRLDASFYDLLASEARLVSFVAIAQGKLPQEHWFCLGRLLTTANGRASLLSWSGSMFEYLMPLLVMPTYEGSILDETYRGVVARQLEYGRERNVPWGVSESGYNKTDAHLNYQYRAFGVPGLGFKRGLADDLVVAPYAAVMALMVAPGAAIENLQRLSREGHSGEFGFYEAIDYTPSRVPPGKTSVTVRSYMAHHQGMGFLSLAYLLLDRPMQRRFTADPALQATDLLLHERVPRTPSIYPHPAEVSAAGQPPAEAENTLRVFTSPSTPTPEVHLLSNGRYHLAITNAGGGYSRWKDLAVTRWHEDPTRDAWGSFCYLRDRTADSGNLFWSAAHQPTLRRADRYEAIYSQGRAEFRRRDGDIDSHVEIAVSPEDDIELRRVTLTNHGRTTRIIELTTFAEIVLAPPAADAAHPAFSNLFVQTEILRDSRAILCTRRPRSGSEKPPWMFHLVTVEGRAEGPSSFETDRAAFIGRGRTPVDPVAMHRDALGDSEGSVLDPAAAIRRAVTLEPDGVAHFHLVTGIAETREGATALIEKYSDRHAADRVFELSWTHSQVVLRRLDITDADTQLYERLASHILYANAALRAPKSVMARNKSGQSALWAYGISGDLPIALVRIADHDHLGLVRQLVKAHAYWRLKGLAADLVIWNEDPSVYRQALQEEIMSAIASLGDPALIDRPGGVFVRRTEQLSEEDRVLMLTVARLIVSDASGPLTDQVNRKVHAEMPPRLFPDRERRRDSSPPARPPGSARSTPPARALAAFNGYGGFSEDGREYVIRSSPEVRTPAPWVNVIANRFFGTVVSESGGAYTWCENAHAYRLTPWGNDPVQDTSGEAFYLRDEDDGHVWSPTPLPAPGRGTYETRHGFGYSVFEHAEGGLESRMTTFVALDAPLKFLVFRLRNRTGRAARLSITGFFELVLGSKRASNLPYVVTEVDPVSNGLCARNAYGSEFAERVAFLDSSEPRRTVCGDRLEFIGRNGDLARPAALERARLSGRVGAGLDPAFAMSVPIDLDEGEEREVAFVFGSARDLGDARDILHRFRGIEPARAALEQVTAYWAKTLGAVSVKTPDPTLDVLANGWLLYQVLACRMWARSGFYQSGGAFGFRDQLQDSMALVFAEPSILREQLLRSASRQFREGDVQHWWHPPLGRGVRTRISDDYLWLPYAVTRYVTAIGDTGVLGERVPFIDGRTLKAEEESYYDLPARSEESGTLYDHCVRAIENGLRFGERGLPLMGSGDWNDGMNLVGEHGKGESVWLAFFLYDVLTRFEPLARLRRDAAFADRCREQAGKLRENIELHAWDGAWYRRAYFDSGAPLGSSESPECQIDALPQSWAILSGAGAPDRTRAALESLESRLVSRELGLIKLFDPPFDTSDLKPGYVKGYVPGVRENGGQYTHAAVWAVMAYAAAGQVEQAWSLFNLINPVRHGDGAEAIERYAVEPYVVAADVYTNPQHAGRGGWTWYTGSAGWMYRLIIESLLGLTLEVDRLRIAPRLPEAWSEFELRYRYYETVYIVRVRRRGAEKGGGAQGASPSVWMDGVEEPSGTVPLRDDGREHEVDVRVG